MKDYADFMMLLLPGESIIAKLNSHKTDAAKITGNQANSENVAHIAIKDMPRQKTFMTGPGILALANTVRTLPPVNLTIDGFDYFTHGEDFRTIYAKIRSTPATAQWFKLLKKHLNIKEFMVPHITIARNISVSDFNQLWPHFKSINWVEIFTVNELTVLQREAFAPFAQWEEFVKLPFESKQPIELPPVKHSMLMPLNQNNNQQISMF